MKVLALIQARMGSTRLPKKVLMDLEGRSVLEHVALRVNNSKFVNETVVVTTINTEDLEIVKLCSNKELRVFCGSEDDVLDRFFQCAKLIKPEHVVRVTADCPMIDPDIIDRVIEKHLISGADYTSNVLKETFPDGEDVEVFKFTALKKAWESSSLKSEREHVTPYIRNHPEYFKLDNLESDSNLSDKRWTLDNQEDYDFIKKVFAELYSCNKLFGMNDILKLLEQNNWLEDINKHIGRNEGYEKSLENDGIHTGD